ncbi:MAG: PRC-barrel domain containing protein [Alphaproteobacteria bacterium]|nr:PRC-barrel domain containing protein [Alphaproteobacteria bacterium]
MKMPIIASAAAAAILIAGSASAQSQGAPQTAALIRVDVTKLVTGNRASKIIGTSVVNEANETVGKVDELLIGPDGRTPYAVLSIGGFLGLGERLVVVPYESLKMAASKIILPGASKEALKALPEYKYTRG